MCNRQTIDSMLWSKFHDKFEDEVMPKGQIAGLDVVYVISHQQGKGPYKISITQTNIYSRLDSYKTALVDFDVLYIIGVPSSGAGPLEKALHSNRYLKRHRIEFPKKRPEVKVRFSEWFNLRRADSIKRAIWDVVGDNKSTNTPYFAYTVSENKIEQWPELSTFEKRAKEKQQIQYTRTRSGTKHARVKKYNPNDEGMGVYQWMKVRSDLEGGSDEGVVIDVPEKKTGRAIVRWSDNLILPLEMSEIIRYAQKVGVRY